MSIQLETANFVQRLVEVSKTNYPEEVMLQSTKFSWKWVKIKTLQMIITIETEERLYNRC
jgi:hypothetical protein